MLIKFLWVKNSAFQVLKIGKVDALIGDEVTGKRYLHHKLIN